MFLIRDIFQTKPGKAKDLVKIFKEAMPHFEESVHMKSNRILTDAVANYWTVVIETETEDLSAYVASARGISAKPEVQEIMKDYMTLVDGGRREIFVVE